MATIVYWITHYGYGGLFVLLALGVVGIPFPDEGLLIFAGSLVDRGQLQLVPTVVAAVGGSISGITLSYGLGRCLGFALLKRYGHIIHLPAERVEPMRQWFVHWGKWSLMFGYFIPGVRHLTAYLSGTSCLAFPVFAVYAYLGAGLWSVTFIIVGYIAGEEWQHLSGIIHRHTTLSIVIVGVLVVIYLLLRRKGQSLDRSDSGV